MANSHGKHLPGSSKNNSFFSCKKNKKETESESGQWLMKGGTSLVKSSIKPSDECVWHAFLLLNQPLGIYNVFVLFCAAL